MTSVFISYSSKDVEIAEIIHKHLADDGCDVWRDKSKIRRDWSKEIADALSKQDVILTLWSENSSNSQWVKNEWITARALGKPIIVVAISTLDKLPLPLRNLDVIVAIDTNINSNIKQQLIKKIKDTARNIEYDYEILPPNRDIPYDSNPDFTGRSIELVELYLEVLGDLSKLNYSKVGLVGIGGVGKTQLAVEFAYRFGYAFEEGGIYWIQGTDPSTWVSQFVNITQNHLGLKIPNPEMNSADTDKQYFIEFKKYCGEHGSKMLLIIDNITDPLDLYKDDLLFPGDSAAKFTVLTLGCNLLFTTRRDFKNRLPNTTQHDLKMLLPEAAYDLITRYRKPDSKEEKEFTKLICNSVGYLPLAIVLIGGYLRKYSEMSIEEYYNEHIKDKLSSIDLGEISADELVTRHEAAIRVTFEPEWKILKQRHGKPVELDRNQNAEKLVSILSLLPESAIVPKNRLIVYSGIERYGMTKLIRPADSAFIFLDELNLIDILEKGKSARIHPLIREYILEKLKKESTENQIINLKLESIAHLRRAYYQDFSSLAQEYAVQRNYDIDSIIEDIRTALLWSKELATAKNNGSIKTLESDMQSIYQLNKVLEQESHNLRPTTDDSLTHIEDKSILFAQRIHIRSTELNYGEIAVKSRGFLLQLKKPFFDIRWTRMHSKEALIMTLEGHSSYVESVAITPDNKKIVSGSDDGTIKIWDIDSGKMLNTLKGHSTSVSSVAITQDNKKIVSASSDTAIKIWDIDTGKLLINIIDLRGHSHWLSHVTVAITPDNKRILSGYDKTIKIWDLQTGKLQNTIKHSKYQSCVAITPDNKKIVSGSVDDTIRIRDLDTGKLVNTIKSQSVNVESVAITPDNKKIVSGAYDETIKIWDIDSGKMLNTLKGHSAAVHCLAITPDNKKIVSGSQDQSIKMWHLETGKLLNTLEGHTGHVDCVAITPDNKKIVSGSQDETIRVWDLETEKLPAMTSSIRGHSRTVECVVITPDNKKIVSGSLDDTIKVWDLDTGKLLNTIESRCTDVHSIPITSVAITPDNKKIVSGSGDKTIKVWDLDSGKLLNRIKGHSDTVSSVAITQDNKKIVSGSGDGTIKIWDLVTGKLLNRIRGDPYEVHCVAITPDNKKIVSGCYDKTIKVWDLHTGKLLNRITDNTGHLVVITSDNKKIVSSLDTIKIWHLETGKLLRTIEAHPSLISSVGITSDNNKIISTAFGFDEPLKVWDLETGKCELELRFEAAISSIAASKYDNLITLGDRTGNLYTGNLRFMEI